MVLIYDILNAGFASLNVEIISKCDVIYYLPIDYSIGYSDFKK